RADVDDVGDVDALRRVTRAGAIAEVARLAPAVELLAGGASAGVRRAGAHLHYAVGDTDDLDRPVGAVTGPRAQRPRASAPAERAAVLEPRAAVIAAGGDADRHLL